MTMITIEPSLASRLLASAGGTLEKLAILTDRPIRDSLVAELCRRLESDPPNDRRLKQIANWRGSTLPPSSRQHRCEAGRTFG